LLVKIPSTTACALLCLVACGNGKNGDMGRTQAGSAACADGCAASGATGSADGSSGTGAIAGRGAGNQAGGAAGEGGDSTAGEAGALYGPRYFRFGDNPGYYGSGIDRRESAQMARAAGASSLRTTLPEYYLQKWGDTIEVSDYAWYEANELGHHVCFLIGPSHDHSSAPVSAQDAELSHYSPKNLYEPIFTANGSVNPNNYWAAYVERVAKNYGQYLDIYEVWNEPDQVGGNWQATEAWNESPPNAKDLIWWNDSIFSYIRMLRITHEVVHRFDQQASVTVGGIGYGSFLSALLRYTDEPKAGSVSAEYPDTAAKYLDILSFHYYPVFGGGSSDEGVDGLLQARDDYRARLQAAGAGERQFVVTETGAPRYAVGGNAGGPEYAASYLIKTMTLGHYEGLLGIDWFAQGDGAAIGASMDSFAYMGLYFDYSKAMQVSDTTLSPQGHAYAWLKGWLANTAADAGALAKLGLPEGVRGAAFLTESGRHLYLLWARTTKDETASAKFALPASGTAIVHTFSVEKGEGVAMVEPSAGTISLSLTGMPRAIELP